jgi:hypothetical protein
MKRSARVNKKVIDVSVELEGDATHDAININVVTSASGKGNGKRYMACVVWGCVRVYQAVIVCYDIDLYMHYNNQ